MLLIKKNLYIFTVISYVSVIAALLLVGIRRPVHDMFLGTVHLRAWQSDLFTVGDWPWWMSHVRYGFTFSTLHFASVFIDPIGVLLSTVFRYDATIYGLDFALHSLLGATGAYRLSRLFLRTSIGSFVVAISFIGSAVVVMASMAGVVHAGYMTLPWVFFAITRIAQSATPRHVIRSVGLLGLSLAWLVGSGYPATWMTLPVFSLPFTAILASTSVSRLLRTTVSCALAAMVGVAILAPWIAETIYTPIFGGAVRNSINPNEGAVPVSGIIGLVLVNPEFFPGANHWSRPPVYLGVVSGLAMLYRALGWVSTAMPRIRTGAILAGCVALTFGSLPIMQTDIASGVLPALKDFELNREPLALAGFIAFLVATMPISIGHWDRMDLALASTTALAWICATDNLLGGLIRTSIPPFYWSRWSYYYLGVAVLTGLILGWRTIEIAVLSSIARADKRSLQAVGYALVSLGVAVVSTLFIPSPGVSTLTSGGSRIGLATVIWVAFGSLVYLLAGVTIWSTARLGKLDQHRLAVIALIGTPAVITIFTVLFGLPLNRNESLIHDYLNLPLPGQLSVDVAHASLVLGTTAILWRFAPRKYLLQGIAIVAIADITLASPRYLSDTDMVIGGQPIISTELNGPFNFTGTNRDQTMTKFINALVARRPSVEPYPILMPQVRDFEERFGSPPIFDQFVHFPTFWTNSAQGSAKFTPESLGRPANPEFASPVGPTAFPDCPASVTSADPRPSAMVTRFLSSYVQVTYETACTRLLAYTDTWAQGWTATIDGTPTPVLHLNGAIRGVIAPAGRHTLEWSYRPAYWNVTKWISLTGLLGTFMCLVWGLWPVRWKPGNTGITVLR